MRNKLIHGLVLLLSWLGLQPTILLAAEQCEDPGSTMLWQVQGSAEPVYLLGSIHLGRPDFYPLPDPVEEAYQVADFLVLEADIEDANNLQFAMELMNRGTLPPGQRLDDLVSAETVARLEAVLTEMGMPAEQFMHMQPWLLNVTLSSLQMLSYGYQPRFGVESYLLQKKSPEMELLELESLEEQLGFLESLNDEVYLLHTLEGFDEGAEEDMATLISAWVCGNHDKLAETFFAELESEQVGPDDMEAFMEVMFYQRNRDMTETIAGYVDNPAGSYFITVGSAHLLGEGSIIDLLQQRGYQVKPVRAE